MVTGHTVAAYSNVSATLLGNETFQIAFHTVLHQPTALCSESQPEIIPSPHLKYALVYHHDKILSRAFINFFVTLARHAGGMAIWDCAFQ